MDKMFVTTVAHQNCNYPHGLTKPMNVV